MGVLRLANTAANIVPRPMRRFVLDQLHVGKLVARLTSGVTDGITLPNGLRLQFNPLLHWNVTKPEYHEPEVVDALRRYLRPGSVFYDLGANVGLHSLIASSIVAPTGRVLAFEPADVNLRYLRSNLAQPGLSNVTLHPIAVGESDGVMRFDRTGAMSGRLLDDWETGVNPIEVPVRSIDSLVAEGNPFPDVIKIDVEGAEGAVLEGARDTLRRHPVVICELHPSNPDGVRRAEAALARAGYNLSRMGHLSHDKHDKDRYVLATTSTYCVGNGRLGTV